MTPLVSFVVGIVLEAPGLFAQELILLGICLLVSGLWRKFRRAAGWVQKKQLVAKPVEQVLSCVPTAAARGRQSAGQGCSFEQSEERSLAAQSDGQQQKQQPEWLRAGEQRVMELLQHREFMRALNVFRSLERREPQEAIFFSESVCVSLVKASIRVGHIDVTERLLKTTAQRCSPKASLDFWRSIFKMLSSRKHFATCVQAFSELKDDLPEDTTVYSCLMNAALETGQAEKASEMLPVYLRTDLVPSDYVVVLRTFVDRGDADAAVATLRKLGAEATALMLNLVLSTCVSQDKLDLAGVMLQNARTLSASKGGGDAMLDTVSYNTVMKSYARKGDRKTCVALLNCMVSHGLQPDEISFAALLDAFIVDDAISEASDLVASLTAAGKGLAVSVASVLLKGLLRASHYAKAMAFYDGIRDAAFEGESKLDRITFSIIIKAALDQRDLVRVFALAADLKNAGHSIDDILLTHLLEACRLQADGVRGVALFEEAMASGVKPSDYTFSTLLKLLGACGENENAYNLLVSWEAKHNSRPTLLHYTCVMSGCVRSKDYDTAWRTYELMEEKRIMPDEMAICTLLRGLAAGHRWDHFLMLTRRAVRNKPPIAVPAQLLSRAMSELKESQKYPLIEDQLHLLMRSAEMSAAERGGC